MNRNIPEIVMALKSLRKDLQSVPPADAPEGIEYTELMDADSGLQKAIESLDSEGEDEN